ncbi:hypothetical protein ACFORG_09160 [Lutimaribacter marinistellae]|uniref:Uncharacterized protein n=1 Tax=Lutimaribacter marinistellae TaxID=1820329 RepID=A0ABV7TFA8_9RHOB
MAIATRAALRVWPLVCAVWPDSSRNGSATKASHEQLILLGSWSQLCATTFAQQASPEVLVAAEQAVNTAKTFHPDGYWSNDFQKAANASGFSVGIVTGEAKVDWVFDLLFQAALFTKEPQKDTSVFISSTYRDADYDARTLISQPLWHDASPPEGLRPEDIGPTLLETDPRFDFFRRWYEGMVRGAPLPLELCRRVATQIPRETWESGAEQVAEAIARIEAEWLAEQSANANRAPEFEPESVAHLFAHPRSVSASVALASVTIYQSLQEFSQATARWLNELPDFLKPLEAVPASLDRIGEILNTQVQTKASEQALREEIGRLQARVAQLETELENAQKDAGVSKAPWFGKLTVLGAGIAALCAGVWTVSGDDIGPKKRCETLNEYWEFFGGPAFNCVRSGTPPEISPPDLPETREA